jgi:hypothetical protein
MRTGRVRWDIEVADYRTADRRPLAVKDKVIVGMAGAATACVAFSTPTTLRPARAGACDVALRRAGPRVLERRQLDAWRRDHV